MSKKSRQRALDAQRAEFSYTAPQESDALSTKLPPESWTLVQIGARLTDQQFKGKPIGYFSDAWQRFARNKPAFVSMCVILFIVVMAIIGPALTPYHFRDQHTHFGILPPRVQGLEKLGIFDGSKALELQLSALDEYEGAVMEILSEYTWSFRGRDIPMVRAKIDMYALRGAKSHYFWFGTDDIGRDMFTRVWRGARISLLIGFISVLINCVIGVVYGSISGYYGGTTDMLMQRFVEILGGVPFLVISILFIMVMGAGVKSFILVLILVNWIPMSRMIRAQFYRYKDYEYVLASRTMGARDRLLIFRHILPNAIGPIITQSTLAIPGAIFAESFLSYLGLGIQAPEPSIGVLLAEGQRLITTTPHLTLFPAIVVSMLMLSLNIFGNGLRDAFDPRLRGS